MRMLQQNEKNTAERLRNFLTLQPNKLSIREIVSNQGGKMEYIIIFTFDEGYKEF